MIESFYFHIDYSLVTDIDANNPYKAVYGSQRCHERAWLYMDDTNGLERPNPEVRLNGKFPPLPFVHFHPSHLRIPTKPFKLTSPPLYSRQLRLGLRQPRLRAHLGLARRLRRRCRHYHRRLLLPRQR